MFAKELFVALLTQLSASLVSALARAQLPVKAGEPAPTVDCDPAWPSGKALCWQTDGMTSVRFRFGSPLSSKVVVCGHCLRYFSPCK